MMSSPKLRVKDDQISDSNITGVDMASKAITSASEVGMALETTLLISGISMA